MNAENYFLLKLLDNKLMLDLIFWLSQNNNEYDPKCCDFLQISEKKAGELNNKYQEYLKLGLTDEITSKALDILLKEKLINKKVTKGK